MTSPDLLSHAFALYTLNTLLPVTGGKKSMSAHRQKNFITKTRLGKFAVVPYNNHVGLRLKGEKCFENLGVQKTQKRLELKLHP